MASGDHRLAADRAKVAAELFETSRQATHTAAGGGDPGVTLADASEAELAALGMSPGVVIPEHGSLQPPPWPPPLVVEVKP